MDNDKLIVKNAEDSQKAFESAKSKGLNNPSEYMYMYSKDNKDFFKNINFRNYISFKEANEYGNCANCKKELTQMGALLWDNSGYVCKKCDWELMIIPNLKTYYKKT